MVATTRRRLLGAGVANPSRADNRLIDHTPRPNRDARGGAVDGQSRSPTPWKWTITMTPPEAAVRHDTADQGCEDPPAGADEARAYRDFWADVGSG